MQVWIGSGKLNKKPFSLWSFIQQVQKNAASMFYPAYPKGQLRK